MKKLIALAIFCILLNIPGALASGPDFVAYLNSGQTIPNEDNNAKGLAFFWLNDDKTELKYKIKVRKLGIEGYHKQGKRFKDLVTKIHLHEAPIGVAGPHVLNIFGLPSEDDDQLKIKPRKRVFKGVWDDGDETLPQTPGSTKKLSEKIEALCEGNLYVNVHSINHAPGAIRGQIFPISDACEE